MRQVAHNKSENTAWCKSSHLQLTLASPITPSADDGLASHQRFYLTFEETQTNQPLKASIVVFMATIVFLSGLADYLPLETLKAEEFSQWDSYLSPGWAISQALCKVSASFSSMAFLFG